MRHKNNRANPFDIRAYKRDLRKKYRSIRGAIPSDQRGQKDSSIFSHVRSLAEYTDATLVLTFVSMAEEIDTHGFIADCLADGKQLAVPYCISGSREMDFHRIDSLDQLTIGTFGVMEPDPLPTTKVSDFSRSICIVPGLTFDRYGYRIGYGGGYYDRFLSVYNGLATIGVCYDSCINQQIIYGRYDIPVKYIATETGIVTSTVLGNSGGKF